MLDAKKMHDTANWQTDLDTLMARVSDHALKVGGQPYLLRFATEKNDHQ